MTFQRFLIKIPKVIFLSQGTSEGRKDLPFIRRLTLFSAKYPVRNSASPRNTHLTLEVTYTQRTIKVSYATLHICYSPQARESALFSSVTSIVFRFVVVIT